MGALRIFSWGWVLSLWWCQCVSSLALSSAVPAPLRRELSPRLSDLVRGVERPFCDDDEEERGLVADVGCDHGMLAAELTARGFLCVAADVAAVPLEGARAHFRERGLEPVAFVLGDGVAALMTDETLPMWCETAVIAGVGAGTAAKIVHAAAELEDAGCCWAPPRRYVLQPTMQFLSQMRHLRATLFSHGYTITEELWRNDNDSSEEDEHDPSEEEDTASLARDSRGRPYSHHRLLITLIAERESHGEGLWRKGRSCPAAARELTEVELLVGRTVDDAARDAYLRHHLQWVETVASIADYTPAASQSESVQSARRWRKLLKAELNRNFESSTDNFDNVSSSMASSFGYKNPSSIRE